MAKFIRPGQISPRQILALSHCNLKSRNGKSLVKTISQQTGISVLDLKVMAKNFRHMGKGFTREVIERI